jgi:hypothetical protein
MLSIRQKISTRLQKPMVAGVVFVALLTVTLPSRGQVGIATGKVHAQEAIANPPSLTLPTVDEMQEVADELDYIKHGLDIVSPAIKNEEFERLNDLTEYTQHFADLALALRTDIAERRNPASNNSHTVEELGKIELDFATKPSRLQDYAALGLIGETTARRLGYFSFGAGDIASGLGTMVGERSLGNVDAAEKVLDGIATTAWGIYGFAVSGDWDVAQAYSSAAGLTAKGVRAMTLPMFEELTAKITGLDQNITSIWEAAQQVRAAHGQPIQSIGEFYHGDASILDRIGLGSLAEADARLGLQAKTERRTVESYRETCIDGYCSRVDLLHPSPATADEHPLGGVRLDQPLTGAALRGVEIDKVHGNIVLLGERGFLARGLNLRDFAMALLLVFGPQPQDPAFSLDPDDIRNPSGPWLRAVYMPNLLEGRSFGEELFAADLRLKELSLQTMLDPDGKLKEWKSSVHGFQSYAGLAIDDTGDGGGSEQWSRFWIVAERVTSRQADNTLLFDAQMAVKARRQVPDPKSATGLRDVDTDAKSLEARWARMATDHYEELAVESPAFARVREMAVAIGIAKSLKAAGANVDIGRVVDLLNSDHTPTVAKINAFSVSWKSRSEKPFHEGNREGVQIETKELKLFGGVDLTVTPLAMPDNGQAARRMGLAVESAFRLARPGAGIARYQFEGSQLMAVAVPLLVAEPRLPSATLREKLQPTPASVD